MKKASAFLGARFYLLQATKLMTIAGLILVFSFLPSVLVDPAYHIVTIGFVTIQLFIYVVLIFLIVGSISILSGRMKPRLQD